MTSKQRIVYLFTMAFISYVARLWGKMTTPNETIDASVIVPLSDHHLSEISDGSQGLSALYPLYNIYLFHHKFWMKLRGFDMH